MIQEPPSTVGRRWRSLAIGCCLVLSHAHQQCGVSETIKITYSAYDVVLTFFDYTIFAQTYTAGTTDEVSLPDNIQIRLTYVPFSSCDKVLPSPRVPLSSCDKVLPSPRVPFSSCDEVFPSPRVRKCCPLLLV